MQIEEAFGDFFFQNFIPEVSLAVDWSHTSDGGWDHLRNSILALWVGIVSFPYLGPDTLQVVEKELEEERLIEFGIWLHLVYNSVGNWPIVPRQ